MSARKKILLAPYSEKTNGPLTEAIEISKKLGCVTWFDPSHVAAKGPCPTEIIIWADNNSFYRGTLLAIKKDGLTELRRI